LASGEHETVDGFSSTKHAELEFARSVRRHWHGPSMATVGATRQGREARLWTTHEPVENPRP
jgi:hypothetical protein